MVVCREHLRLQFDRPANFSQRLIQLSHLAQRAAEIIVRLGIVFLEPDRAAKLRNGRLDLPQLHQRDAKPIMKPRIISVHLDRASKARC